jgi:hypothetical protein
LELTFCFDRHVDGAVYVLFIFPPAEAKLHINSTITFTIFRFFLLREVDCDFAAAAIVVGDLVLLGLAEDDGLDLLLEALEGASPPVAPDAFRAALLFLLWLLTTEVGRIFLREGI